MTIDPESGSHPTPPSTTPPSSALIVAALAAVVPIVVATVRAVARGWMPISENALFELRARDVFTGDIPLLGTASSISVTTNTALNHPGPLMFEWLAIPVRLFGGHAGVAIGVGLLNVTVVLTAGYIARRVGGDIAALAVLLGGGFVAWVMGSELLFDPWNPNVLMLPAYAFIVSGWALASGSGPVLPVTALLGSICLQTHLSYVYLVPIVTIGALVLGRPRLTRRIVVTTAAVIFVAWLPPIIEQLQHGRHGNLWGLARAGANQEASPIGVGLGTRLTAAVLTHRPWDARGGFATAVPPTAYEPDGRLPSIDTVGLASAWIRLAIVVIALVALWRWGRRHSPVLASIAPFTLLVIGAGWFSVIRMPIGAIGLSPHQMRWLWSIAGWLIAVAALATATLVRTRTAGATTPVWVVGTRWGVAVLTVVLAIANLGQYVQPAGPALVAWRIPSVAALTAQTVAALDASPPAGPVWVDTRDIPYFDVYYQSVMTAIDEAGYAFQVDDPIQLRQVGPRRALDDQATTRLHLLFGFDAFVPTSDETMIAIVSELDPDDEQRLSEAIDTLVATLDTTGIALTPAGEAAERNGALAFDTRLLAPGDETGDTTRPPIGDLVAAWGAGYLDTNADLDAHLQTIAAATDGAGSVVAVVTSPIETGRP